MPANAQNVLITINAVRRRPTAAGASTISPHVTYQDHTMGPSKASTRRVRPRHWTYPSLGDRSSCRYPT